MIREKVSQILGIAIREGKWIAYTDRLDAEGKFDKRKIQLILMALCESVEELEKKPDYSISSLNPELSSPKTALISPAIPEVSHFTCPDCQKTFPTKLALIGHGRSHAKRSTNQGWHPYLPV